MFGNFIRSRARQKTLNMAVTAMKRPATTDSDVSVKKARITQKDSEETTPTSTYSVVSTDQQSLAETSLTSRSTSKRPKKYICTYNDCGKAFDRPVRLEAHIHTHTGDRPFACDEDGCDKRFFKPEHLKAHVQNKHRSQADYVCDYVLTLDNEGEEQECGKAFVTATRLRRHKAAHEQKEELRCTEESCGQVFRKMETLQRHIKKEHLKEEKSFMCYKPVVDETGMDHECGESFATVSKLKAHEYREHVGKKHFCEICSPPNDVDDPEERVGFHTYGEFQAHMREAHPPTCETCGKVCESNRALTAHMDIEHSSLESRQKYQCSYPDCGRSFTKSGNLNVHVQNVHVKAAKFVCGEYNLSESEKCPGWTAEIGCGRPFGTKATLENHVRTQHLDLPTLRRRRQKVRVKGEADTPMSSMDVDEDADVNRTEGAGQDNTLSMLTGQGYATSHPIACWMTFCDVRFTRSFDLAQHLEHEHQWHPDDINDCFAEQAALNGGQFWVGGSGEDQHGDQMLVDSAMDEDGMRNALLHDLSVQPTVEYDAGFGMGDEIAGGGLMEEFLDDTALADREEDAIMVDPALAGM